jgi:hypothetical protein
VIWGFFKDKGKIMNTQQPEALRLANALEQDARGYEPVTDAAAELRRLHSVNAVLLKALEEATEKLEWFTDSYPSDLAVSTDEFFSTITKAIAKAQE